MISADSSAGTLADPAELSALITAVSRYVVVDPTWDLLAFAAQARGLTAGAISFRTIPTGRPDLPTPEDGVAVQVDPGAVRDFVATLSEGVPPSSPTGRGAANGEAASGGEGGSVGDSGEGVVAVDGDDRARAAAGAVDRAGQAPAPITAAGISCVN